jgi:AcrR family transcriptional regulator
MKGPVKPVSGDTPRPRARGRPRSLEAHGKILAAARALLAEAGPGGVTVEAVAVRAGVGKPTIYRWWPDRHAVLMAALMESEGELPQGQKSRVAVRALARQLAAIVERFRAPSGRHIATMIAAADPNTELAKAFRNHFVLARRAEGRALLELAVAQGELRTGLDLDVALDLLYGPLFFRLLMGHAPLDEAFTASLLRHALAGLGPK